MTTETDEVPEPDGVRWPRIPTSDEIIPQSGETAEHWVFEQSGETAKSEKPCFTPDCPELEEVNLGWGVFEIPIDLSTSEGQKLMELISPGADPDDLDSPVEDSAEIEQALAPLGQDFHRVVKSIADGVTTIVGGWACAAARDQIDSDRLRRDRTSRRSPWKRWKLSRRIRRTMRQWDRTLVQVEQVRGPDHPDYQFLRRQFMDYYFDPDLPFAGVRIRSIRRRDEPPTAK